MILDILLTDGNTVSFSNNDIMECEIKQNTSDENKFMLGSCIAASCDFAIWNGSNTYSPFYFKDSIVNIYTDDQRRELFGTYHIDTITRNKSILKFECTDNMTKLDVNFRGIINPFTLYGLLTEICDQCGLILVNNSILNGSLQYTLTEGVAGVSCRELLKYICEISCNYAYITNDGKLHLKWYTDEEEAPIIDYRDFMDYERAEDFLTVGGVYFSDEMKTGSGYRVNISSSNNFFSGLNYVKQREIISNVNIRLGQLTFLPCKFRILDWTIPIGSAMRIRDEEGILRKIYICYKCIKNFNCVDVIVPGQDSSGTSRMTNTNIGGNSDGTKINFSKDINASVFNIRNLHQETNLNTLSIYAVNETSSCFLSYNLEFSSNIETTIKINLYNNDILIKTIQKDVKVGINHINFAEQAILSFANTTNTFKIFFDTVDTSSIAFSFDIQKEASSLNAITNAEVDEGGQISSITFKEEISEFTIQSYSIFTFDRVSSYPIEEVLDMDLRPIIDAIASDNIGLTAHIPKNKSYFTDIDFNENTNTSTN